MEASELRKKSVQDLRKTLKDKSGELQKASLEILQKKEKNTSKLKFLRKDIARLKTLIREKESLEISKEDKKHEQKA